VKTAELLLHPVRLRIIGAFLGDRKLTTADLRAELPDVPPTSLYRHLGHLIDAGVLDVVAERRVRGTVERTYVFRAAPPISPADLASWTPDDHRRAFCGYVAALLADFDRYLDQKHIDLRRDGTGYRMVGLWMTDQELNELTQGFLSLLQPYMANPATPDRRRRILRTIVLPAPDSTPAEDHNSRTTGGAESAPEHPVTG
jgi:AcrR family transcriptional regulator